MYQFFDAQCFAHAGELLEYFVYVFTNGIIAGEEAVVGIHARIAGVIVAGSEVHVAFIFVAFLAHNQHHFGVGFIAHYAIHHHRAGFLQTVGEVQVFFFVEACTQLNHHRDFFAIAGGIHQCIHDFGFSTRSIQRLFNGAHVRVFGRFTQQVHHRGERFKRVQQKGVAVADAFKNALFEINVFRKTGGERRILQIGAIDLTNHFH